MKSPIRIPKPFRLLLGFSLGVWSGTNVPAKNADNFFHGGAQWYLSNNVPAALEVVTNGLQQFPDDEKLQKLYELLQQQNQQNQQDQSNQDQQQQEQQQQNQKPDPSKDQKNQNEKNDSSQSPDEKKPDPSKDQNPTPQDQRQNKSEKQPQDGNPDQEANPMEAHKMTPEEAKQLLNAQKGDEQLLLFQPQGEPKNRNKPLKDW